MILLARMVVVALFTLLASVAYAASIVSVTSGAGGNIALLTESSCCISYGDFGLHAHNYVAPNVPDPESNYVIFEFDTPVVVSGLTMIQHANGITILDHLVGNSVLVLANAGQAVSSFGDVTGSSIFTELAPDVFVVDPGGAGLFHKFIIAKTSLADGYASYRWNLDVAAPVPEPETYVMLFAGLGVIAAVTRRRLGLKILARR